MALTAKQQAFVDEYLIDLNATQAAIRAGYSRKTAAAVGAENLRKPQIAEMIARAKTERSGRTQIDADWLLRVLGGEAVADVADLYSPDTGALKPVHEWPEVWRRGLVSGIDVQRIGSDENAVVEVVKVKLADRTRIKELIGKHVDVQAFRERMTHDGSLVEDMADLMKQISNGAT